MNSPGQVIVYESGDGEARVDVRFDKETVWLDAASNGGAVRAGSFRNRPAHPQRLP